MNVKDIIELACFESNTSIDSYNKKFLLKQLNQQYEKIYRTILSIDEDYFWTFWLTDISKGKKEYAITRKGTLVNGIPTPGIEKILEVKVKEGEKYTVLKEVSKKEGYESILADTVRYGRFLSDNHLQLTYSPSKNIKDGLMIVGISSIEELKEDEDSIFPGHQDLQQYTGLLLKGLKYELLKAKGDYDKAKFTLEEYNYEKDKMLRYISNRGGRVYFSKIIF